ncbi:MAG: hypothetical protein WC307_04565 [Candidatus Nanoarchaeia archaeon]|jgi:hypothetical protein
MNYKGVIIEESLVDKSVLDDVTIITTNVELVTNEHQTPWLEKWTLHTIIVPMSKVDLVAEKLSQSLDPEHDWYADFKNDFIHYIVFRGKVFKVNRKNKEEYEQVTKYGLSLGIPDYQLDFSPEVK